MSVTNIVDRLIKRDFVNLKEELVSELTARAVEKLEEEKIKIAQEYFGQK